MSRLTSSGGFLRRPGGAYYNRPRTDVVTPAITANGQAVLIGDQYFQNVTIPTPPDGLEWRIDRIGYRVYAVDAGVQDIAVAALGESEPRVRAFLVQTGKSRPTRAVTVPVNLPSLQPLGIGGSIAITSAPFVGGPFTPVFPVITSGTPISDPTVQVRIYAAAGDAVAETTLTPPFPATYQAGWAGKLVTAYWAVVDPARSPALQAFESSPRQIVTAATTPAPTLADITILRSASRDGGHSPIFTVASAFAGYEIQYRAGPTTEDGPWFATEANPGGAAGERRLADGFDPLFPTVNAAVFFPGPPRPARNDRLRFRWRPSAAASWSADGDLFSVPNVVFPPATSVDVTVNSVSAMLAEQSRTSPLRRRIAIAPGTYGAVTFPSRIVRDPENEVFFVPEDYGNAPIFNRAWSFPSQSSGVNIVGLRFRNSESITGRYSYSYNGGVCYVDTGTWPAPRTAITATNVNRFAVINCEFDFWDIVINGGSSTMPTFTTRPSGFDFNSIHGQPSISRNIRFEYNTLTRTGMDGLRLYNNVNFVLRGNRSENPLVDTARAACDATRHCDFLQLTINRYAFGAYDSIIEDNWVVGIDGYYQLILLLGERISRRNGQTSSIGGFADDPNGLGDPEVYGHRNLQVRGNHVTGGHVAGYYLGGVHNLLMETNIARAISSNVESGNRPSCVLVGKNHGTIRNNVWAGGQSSSDNFSLRQSGSGSERGPTGTLAEITRSNNVISSTAVPPGWDARHPGGLRPKTGQYGYNGGTPTSALP